LQTEPSSIAYNKMHAAFVIVMVGCQCNSGIIEPFRDAEISSDSGDHQDIDWLADEYPTTEEKANGLTGAIVGIIKNSATNQAVVGATISTNPPTKSVESDSNGYFRIDGLKVGVYTLSAQLGTHPCILYTERSGIVVEGEKEASGDLDFEDPGSITKKVMVIAYDPIIESRGNKRLHEIVPWQDPRFMTQQYLSTLETCSHNRVHFLLVDWKYVDEFPVKKSGFRYTDESYISAVIEDTSTPDSEWVDYLKIISNQDITNKINSGFADEIIIGES